MKLGTLCYVEKNNQYLMLHRVKKENDMHSNLWVGLGGKFEAGESPEECVIREVFEESGLTVKNPTLKGIMTFNEFNNEDWYVFLFTADDFTGEVTKCDEGELVWIDKDKLDDLPMHGGDRFFLKWMQGDRGLFSVKFCYGERGLKDYKIVFY
jgi:8-oxo-dGTP diphosphatase